MIDCIYKRFSSVLCINIGLYLYHQIINEKHFLVVEYTHRVKHD